MAVAGLGQALAKTKAMADSITNTKVPRALYAASTIGMAYTKMLTPVDTSNLINSMFRRMQTSRHGTKCVIGFTASYAMAVHNAKGTLKGQPRRHFGKTKDGVEFGGGTGKGNYWDPDAEPKFLEKGFNLHRDEIDNAVKRALSL